jgi:hypothetical protein
MDAGVYHRTRLCAKLLSASAAHLQDALAEDESEAEDAHLRAVLQNTNAGIAACRDMLPALQAFAGTVLDDNPTRTDLHESTGMLHY